jgi:hypothetical protein
VKIFNSFQEKRPNSYYFVRSTSQQRHTIQILFLRPSLYSAALSLFLITRCYAAEIVPSISPDTQNFLNLGQDTVITQSAPIQPTDPGSINLPKPLPGIPPTLPPATPVKPAENITLPQPAIEPTTVSPKPDLNDNKLPADPSNVLVNPIPKHLSQDPEYLIRPRARDPKTVKPITTGIIIDGNVFTHRSQFEVSTGIDTGDKRSTDLSWNARWLQDVTLQESTSKDRVYRREYQSTYGRFGSVRQRREVVTNVVAPETAIGFRQQISLIADCLPSTPLGADGKPQICTYVPGISTERTIDPRKLIPRGTTTTSSFQDIVSPASAEAMKQPGFQAGANGEEFAVNFYVPLSGTRAGNTQSNISQIDRREIITNSTAINVGKMRQVILSNGNENALGRTVRGFTYVGGDPNFSLNSAVMLATIALPDAEPSLPPGIDIKPAFNTALFEAADNARLPANSFTAYSVGWGRSQVPKKADALPTANYHGVWIGLSPVIHRSINSDKYYETTGPEIITSEQGTEGGLGSPINVDVTIDGQKFTNAGLANAYAQTYLTLYERDVNAFSTSIIREKTSYSPHISLTGNITTADSVLRYYTGSMFVAGIDKQSPSVQAYLGGDFSKTEPSGLSYKVGAIGYINPTPEDYSQMNANISQKIKIGNNPQNFLILSSGALYALDGDTFVNGSLFRSGSSYVNVSANARFGNIAFGTTYFIPTGLPNEVESLLSTSISWRVTSNLILSGYYTPINNNISKSTMGASTSWRMGNDPNSPTLSLSWNRNEIDFSRGSSTPINNYSDNVFGIYFRFGAPGNPFQSSP